MRLLKGLVTDEPNREIDIAVRNGTKP